MSKNLAHIENTNEINNKPLISVIIPVYNVEKYFDRCISSVVKQTYESLEIILVDDGSTDSSGALCDKWSEEDHRIQVIHKENGGLSSARNAGIEASNGIYLSFIDSDDWVSNDYIEYLYKLLISQSADMAMGAHIITDRKCSFECSNIQEKKISSRDFLLKILKYNTQENVQYAWAKLYRNFKNTELRYPDGLIDEDVPTTFKYVSSVDSVAISTKPIYAYFTNSNSILRQKFTRKRFDLIKVWDITAKFASENCDPEIAEYALINYYRANFGALCNICTKEIDNTDINYITKEENKALAIIKQHRHELLSYPMPMTRKIMIIAFCKNYHFVKEIFKILKIRVNV